MDEKLYSNPVLLRLFVQLILKECRTFGCPSRFNIHLSLISKGFPLCGFFGFDGACVLITSKVLNSSVSLIPCLNRGP